MNKGYLPTFVAAMAVIVAVANISHSETAQNGQQRSSGIRSLFSALRIEGGDTKGGVESLELQLTLLEVSLNRMKAARNSVDDTQSSFDRGNCSIDLLMDVKRRAHDAETEFRACYREFDSMLLANLKSR